ncbi:MAG: 5-formyltetrahydrofolate cyclo-ligase [Candidatus Aceula meridiana]|nr:5-formyltetrahydrofolate cyclo-ligase [Candidatus Aceula meridiana]
MKDNPKKALRQRLLELIRNQKEDIRLKKSELIQAALFKTPEFRAAKIIMFYSAFDGEVETLEMIKQAQNLGKKIALPITVKEKKEIIPSLITNLETSLIDGPYGIKQPKEDPAQKGDLCAIDLVIVPGVAFDKKGNRLGRGEGYYDRFLKTLPQNTPKIGLAFDFQVVDCLPCVENHDVSVSFIIRN